MQNPLDAYNLAGKVAVVTGAASGIGESAAEVFAACGAAVVCADLNATGAGATAQRISDAGGRALAMACNVTSRDDVRTLVDKAVAEFGHVDIMCNVAGAMFPGLIEDLTDEVLDAGIALNLKGVIYGTQYGIKAMRASGRGGSIINVSSGAIDLPYEGIGLYAFTKAAVAMLSMTAAKEVGRYGIRVNAIAPGSTMTAFIDLAPPEPRRQHQPRGLRRLHRADERHVAARHDRRSDRSGAADALPRVRRRTVGDRQHLPRQRRHDHAVVSGARAMALSAARAACPSRPSR